MLSETIVQTLTRVLGDRDAQLHEPVFCGNEWNYVKDCIDSTFVSSVGAFVDRFEKNLADYTGAKCAIATVNGTAALQICLKLAGVEQNDEVLVPALSFVATANAVSYCNAVPHFIDSSFETLGICPRKLEAYLGEIGEIRSDGHSWNKKTNRRIIACIPMHTFGHPVDLDPLLELCDKLNIKVIEDAAESLGTLYKGRHTGTYGAFSALSFNGNKIITTGGGGAILTNDSTLGAMAKHITTTAKVAHRWRFFHDCTGYNFRLPNINAALGCAQLEKLPEFLNLKRSLAERYIAAFKNIPGVSVFSEPEFARSNYWLNVLLLDSDVAKDRDAVLESANNAGKMTRPAWILLSRLPMYSQFPCMELHNAQQLESRIINIPSGAGLAMFNQGKGHHNR